MSRSTVQRKSGEGRPLDATQEASARKLITDKTPYQLKMAEHADEIEVFYLPSYSPELNPDEMANADIKQAGTKLQLAKATARHLRSAQHRSERIRKYFEHGPVRHVT